jgi:hypothetical protein
VSHGPRVPVRFRSLDGALADAKGAGVAVVVQAGERFTLAFSTSFGPCLRSHAFGEDAGFLLRVIDETARGKSEGVSIAGASGTLAERILSMPGLGATGAPCPGPLPEAETAAALAAFAAARPPVPVHSGRGPSARARSSTIAPCPGTAYEHGQVLRPRFERREQGCAIRWRRADGGDAGIHVLLDRMPSQEEIALVRGADGVVVSVVPGAMPWRDGTRRVQTLLLDVPHAFASAFPDGRMPRHGLSGDPR